jgi:hypothetical protein
MKRILSVAEVLIIVIVALIPLFPSLPYRLNSYLSWEGAYRMANGQVPYRDFGMPVGYMYWVIPTLFFKIFGAQMITLIKAQAFINILSGLAFRSIFKSLDTPAVVRFCGVVVFCLSFSLPNYWPWYNHTVIVYQFIGIAFLLNGLLRQKSVRRYIYIALSGAFIFFSFFTKQDAGALGLLICLGILIYFSLVERRWKETGIFVIAVAVTALAMIVPFINYGFGYWFNYGQSPHTSRISLSDIVKEFLLGSQWIKFYLLLTVLLLLAHVRDPKIFVQNKKQMIMLLLTLGILAEAAIFQVTSYLPVDNNIFYHSFAITYILFLLSVLLPVDFNTWKTAAICSAVVLLWWSQAYWKYIERFVLPSRVENVGTNSHAGYTYSNEVNKNTYMIELDTTAVPLHQWKSPGLWSFHKILMPGPTADGVNRLMNMPIVHNKQARKVLNMSELTPLAAELPFELERGSHYPLWFHKGVGMFEKETNMFVDRINGHHYDLVIYQYVPYSNNFYPFKVREALLKNYHRVDTFPVPRNPSSHAWVEIYLKDTIR